MQNDSETKPDIKGKDKSKPIIGDGFVMRPADKHWSLTSKAMFLFVLGLGKAILNLYRLPRNLWHKTANTNEKKIVLIAIILLIVLTLAYTILLFETIGQMNSLRMRYEYKGIVLPAVAYSLSQGLREKEIKLRYLTFLYISSLGITGISSACVFFIIKKNK